jgi:uncharacterized repeat protein (TIGR01451 family)
VDVPVDPKSLSLRKSAGKSTISAGDYLSYEVTLENSESGGTVFSAVVTDILPPGFRYQKGSTRINGLTAADPAVSPDGRTLTFAVGDIEAQGSVIVRYVVGVGAGAKPGTAVNVATVATTPPISSNTASASVLVQEPFLQSRNIVMGRVFVGACSDKAEDNKKGMEGIGIYLEDGTFVVTDRRGMFHLEGVRSGTHVVQLDLDSIPEGYRILPCEQNSRFAGRAYSQFVELQGGTMWRADFHLGRKDAASAAAGESVPEGPAGDQGATSDPAVPVAGPSPAGAEHSQGGDEQGQGSASYKGEIALEMISSQSGEFIDYRIALQAASVPLNNLHLKVTLPAGAIYLTGSSNLSGAALPDPDLTAGVLSYYIGAADANWQKELRFRISLGQAAKGAELQTKALLTFDSPSAKEVAAPEVDNIVSVVREESQVSLPAIVLHPQFPTFGAELSEADRKQLDDLAVVLSRFNIDNIQVTGHTDKVRIAPRSRKVYQDNDALSFARAKSVGRYLTAALRLAPERLDLHGKGEREPVASNKSAAGRAQNRRVEVKVSLSQAIETSQLKMIKDRSGVKKQETAGAGSSKATKSAGAAGPVGSVLPAGQVAADVSPGNVQATGSEQQTGTVQQAGGRQTTAASLPVQPAEAKPPIPAPADPVNKIDTPKGEERVELVSALSDGIVHYRIKLVGVKGPLEKVTVSLAMPESVLYMEGTSRLAGTPATDPVSNESALVYDFAPLPRDGKLDLRLQGLLDGENPEASLDSSVTVVIADAAGKSLKTFTAKTELSDNMAEIERQDLAPATTPGSAAAKESGPTENINDYVEKVAPRGETPDRGVELHVEDAEGIVSPLDGTIIASQVNAVRVVLNSGLTPLLTLDGKEIPAERIGFKMNDREREKTLYTYIGVDFGAAGEHLLQLKGVDSFGVARFDKTAKISRAGEIAAIRLVSAEGNIADGRTPVKVRIELLDKDGRPVAANAELVLKAGDLRPLSLSGNLGKDAGTGLVSVDAQGWISFEPVTASGLYRVQLAYNKATLELESYVKPKMRDWILVGLAEGTAGYNVASGNMESLKESGAEEQFYDDERLAFYAKGTIKGEWLLTMAFDSAKRSTGVAGNSLFQQIDPNAFYTLYGDATVQGYEAASQRKLFVKVERDQFYAMFGDFDTGLSITELSRYSRRLNGFKAEFRSKDYEVTAFGSETGQSFVKDEIRGDGTSLLYRLSRRGMVINSESIRIESRDRFHSERVTESRQLSRFVDYSIDYEAGTIFFKGRVPTWDDKLNPVYVVVDYEIADAGKDALTYGGRAGTKLLNDKLRIGGSYVHEGHLSGDGDLFGADATLTLGPGTKARAEIATSKDDTTLKTSGSAYLAEITHTDSLLDGKAYYREQQSGFGLGQQMASEAGTRKFGAEGAYKLTPKTILSAQAYRQYNLEDDTVRDFMDAVASYSDKDFSTRAGLRYADDTLADGSSKTSVLGTVGASWKTLGQRLTLRADHEQALFSKDDNADFPTRTILGADYQVSKEVLIFAQEELTYGDAADTNRTQVGIKATPWSGGTVSSSVMNDINENGARTFANVGLAQKWQLTPSWTVDGGLDRNQTIRKKAGYRLDTDVPPASGGEDFTAVSLGANYQEKKLVWSNRVEYRNGESEDKWGLISGIVNEQGVSWGWTGRLQLLHTQSLGGNSRTDADLRLGLAYRPPVTSWIVLDRLDLVATDEKSAGAASQGKRIINNLNANYRPNKKSQLSLQYGAKYVLEQIDEADYSGFTDLIGIEGRYDLSSSWDIGLRSSMLHSWELNQVSYSLGPSVGCNLMENAWLSLGYNLLGFHDKDLSAASFTSQGPFVQFRFKFDQNTIKDGLSALNQ